MRIFQPLVHTWNWKIWEIKYWSDWIFMSLFPIFWIDTSFIHRKSRTMKYPIYRVSYINKIKKYNNLDFDSMICEKRNVCRMCLGAIFKIEFQTCSAVSNKYFYLDTFQAVRYLISFIFKGSVSIFFSRFLNFFLGRCGN